MLAYFFNRSTALQAVGFPQDPSGGTVPTPSTLDVLVPCCVQQDTPPEENGKGRYQRGSRARLRVFFGPSYSATPDLATTAVQALVIEARLVLDDGRTIVLTGPPYDEAGRGAYYVAECLYTT